MVLGISYGELFLIVGATVALVGPKDLPVIARAVGRMTGRAIGYFQWGRGQLDSVLQHSQAIQLRKELQNEIARFEAVRYEIRRLSNMDPSVFTRTLDVTEGSDRVFSQMLDATKGSTTIPKSGDQCKTTITISEDSKLERTFPLSFQSQAVTYARLAEAQTIEARNPKTGDNVEETVGDDCFLTVLPVSAESAKLLPKRSDAPMGSDILVEAILEAEVAHDAKDFYAQNQIPNN